MALIDEALREMAFTEDEAKILLKKRFGGEKIQTLEDEIKATKQALGL